MVKFISLVVVCAIIYLLMPFIMKPIVGYLDKKGAGRNMAVVIKYVIFLILFLALFGIADLLGIRTR